MPESTSEHAGSDLFATISYDTSRRNFLRRAGTVAAAGSVVGMLSACSDDDSTGPTGSAVVTLPLRSDGDILKFALFLELLEADFYTRAVARGVLTGPVAALATSIRDHELAHVAFLQSALGSEAFGFGDVSFDFAASLNTQASFLATAQVLEQTGVGAYLGALGSIQSRGTRVAAGSIFTVEARHLAAVRAYNNASGGPVPNAFETGVAPEAVIDAVSATGFVRRGLG
jgi:rubrerythrin